MERKFYFTITVAFFSLTILILSGCGRNAQMEEAAQRMHNAVVLWLIE
jgi:hypothetical protein